MAGSRLLIVVLLLALVAAVALLYAPARPPTGRPRPDVRGDASPVPTAGASKTTEASGAPSARSPLDDQARTSANWPTEDRLGRVRAFLLACQVDVNLSGLESPYLATVDIDAIRSALQQAGVTAGDLQAGLEV